MTSGCMQGRTVASILIGQLLEVGSGLTLGPDSDGLLNFCDPPEGDAAAPQEGEERAAKGKGKKRAGSSINAEVTIAVPFLLGEGVWDEGADDLEISGYTLPSIALATGWPIKTAMNSNCVALQSNAAQGYIFGKTCMRGIPFSWTSSNRFLARLL